MVLLSPTLQLMLITSVPMLASYSLSVQSVTLRSSALTKTLVSPSAPKISVHVYIAVYGRSCFDDNRVPKSQFGKPLATANHELQLVTVSVLH